MELSSDIYTKFFTRSTAVA